MSYLRDGEEPTRWAFCSLGQSRRADDAPSEEQPRPTPLVDGSFYPASESAAGSSSLTLHMHAHEHVLGKLGERDF